jgi:hypothetical protein
MEVFKKMRNARQFSSVSFSILCLAILSVSVSGARADGILGADLAAFSVLGA